MVVFTCQYCGMSVKKTKVDKHYNTRCRLKNPCLTCVDCLKDFMGQEYIGHIQCVSETERYSAEGTNIKEPVGKKKQEKYLQTIQTLLKNKDLTTIQRKLLEVCSKFQNVPRKQGKFHNFIRNVRNIRCTDEDIHSLFKLLDDAWKAEIQSNTKEELKTYKYNNSSDIKASLPLSKSENEDHNEGFSELNCNVTIGSQNVEKSKCNDKDKSYSEEIKSTGFNENNDENINIVSKKQIKKQKKYEMYLQELENVAKATIKEDFENGKYTIDKNNKNKSTDKIKTVNLISDPQDVINEDNEKTGNFLEVTMNDTKISKCKKRKKEDSKNDKIVKKKKTETVTEGEESNKHLAKFNWTEVIVKILKNQPDNELSLKRLAKKLICEYQIVKPDHRTYDELLAKFNNKVNKTKGVRVLRDKAKLIEK